MSVTIYPLVGLIWETTTDPTLAPGIPAPLGQFAIWTTESTLYYKATLSDTGWVALGGGSGDFGDISALPERWAINTGILAGQTATEIETLVSTGFSTYRAARAGTIRDIGWRLSSPVTAGSLTINITIDGAPIVLAGISTSGSNPSGGQASQDAEIANFAAGSLIGMTYTTDGLFAAAGAVLEATINVGLTTE